MIQDKIHDIVGKLPSGVKLVAVSKFHSVPELMEAYRAGQRCFGENRPQEFAMKVPEMPSDIEWHFIGHLQTNKLKMVLPYVSLIQSVDSLRLLEAINNWGTMNGKVLDVLLEPHVAAEETKQGFSCDEIMSVLSSSERYPNICFKGIMGMATFTDDEEIICSDFSRIREIHDAVRREYPVLADDFTELSIGMSDDYPLAIKYGSTMVRIGSMIFGSRNYGVV